MIKRHRRNEKVALPTMLASPGFVMINLWCTRPYKSSAEDSTIDTSGIFAESSSTGESAGFPQDRWPADQARRPIPSQAPPSRTAPSIADLPIPLARTSFIDVADVRAGPTCQIEIVLDELLVNFAEIVVSR